MKVLLLFILIAFAKAFYVSVTGVSVNTGNTGDTVMPSCPTGLLVYKNLEATGHQLYVGCSEFVVFGQNLFKVFGAKGTLASETAGPIYCYTLVLKDPLKLFTGGNEKIFNQMTVNPSTPESVSINQYHLSATGSNFCFAFDDIPGSGFLLIATEFAIRKALWIDGSEFPAVALGVVAKVTSMGLLTSLNAVLLTQESSTSIPILDRSTFNVIKNPTISAQIDSPYKSQIDNLAPQNLFILCRCVSTNNCLFMYDMNTNPTGFVEMASTDLSLYEGTNQIMNFGPYQYVVTIHSSKLDSPSKFISLSELQQDAQDPYKYYFGTIEAATNNFQSYYLLVNKCILRDEMFVCQTCEAGAYKTHLNPNNQCILPLDFPQKTGIEESTQSIKPCISDCILCTNNYQICTECDTSRGYILQNGQCILEEVLVQMSRGSETKTRKLQADLIFRLKPDSHLDSSNIWSAIKLNTQEIKLHLEMVPKDKLHPEFVQLKQNVYWTKQGMMVEFKFGRLVERDYKAKLKLAEPFKWTDKRFNYSLSITPAESSYFNEATAAELKSVELLADTFIPLKDDGSIIPLIVHAALLAADPTGTFFRFTKILQIVNKLYFININYGKSTIRKAIEES